jgi:hypothetical protein
MTPEQEFLIQDAVQNIRETLEGFDDQSARNLLASVVSDTKEGLPDAIADVVERIALLQTELALVDLCKTLPAGVVQICMKDGVLAGRIDPRCKVTKTAKGIDIEKDE